MKNAQKQKLRLAFKISLGVELFCILLLAALSGQKSTSLINILLLLALGGILLFMGIIVVIMLTATFFLIKSDYKSNKINLKYIGKIFLEWFFFMVVFSVTTILTKNENRINYVREIYFSGISATFIFLLQRTLQYMRRLE